MARRSHVKAEERERLFAAAYAALRFNGSQAAISIGMAPKSAHVEASKLLKKPSVQKLVNEHVDKAVAKSNRSMEAIVAELEKIGFANMQDFVSDDGHGNLYLDFSTATRDQMAAVGELIVDEYTEGHGDDARNVKRVRFKLLDKKGALVDLLRYHDKAFDAKSQGGGNTYNVIMNMPGVASPKLEGPPDAKQISAKVISLGPNDND